MVIAYDNKSVGITDNGDISFSHTTAGSNRLLVVILNIRDSVARTEGAPTYAGAALTKAGTTIVNASGLSVEIWYKIAPATGTNTVFVPNATDKLMMAVHAASFTGVDQTSPLETNTGTTGTSTTPSANVSTANTDLVINGMIHESTAASTNIQGTLLYAVDEGTWDSGSHYIIQTSSGSQTLSWTNSNSDIWAEKIAAFKPLVTTVALSSSATTVPTLTRRNKFLRTLSKAVVTVPAMSKWLSLLKTLSVSVVTVPSLSRIVYRFITLSASAGNSVAIASAKIFSKTLSTIVGTSASFSTKVIYLRTLASSAITTATLSKITLHLKTLSTSATSVVALYTKGISLVLRNAANALVTNTLVKWGIFEYDSGSPSNANWMNLSDKGTDFTGADGSLKIPYTGSSAKGETVYVSVLHPEDTPTESMIWTETII